MKLGASSEVWGWKYPSNLRDKPWQKLEKFFARANPRRARSKYPKHRVVEAIFYRPREGCRGRALPARFSALGLGV